MAQVGSELLLVGVDIEGYGAPCYPRESGHGEIAAVIAGQSGLVAQALAAAGLSPVPPDTTCLTIGGKQTCENGVAYQLTWCVSGPSVIIQQQTAQGWSTVATSTATKVTTCPKSASYLLNFYGVNPPGETFNYRASVPKQPGNPQASYLLYSVATTTP